MTTDTTQDYRRVPIDDLEPYPGNARRGNLELIVDSLRRYGQYRPLVVQRQTMRVLAGNHTLAAAVKLGWTHVDATLLDCDDDTAARINLVDNRSNDVAGYDTAALAAQLAGLPDLDGTGWDTNDLAALLEEMHGGETEAPALTDPDDVPEPVEGAPVVSALGDVWELGPHRLMCGDSTDRDAVRLLCAGAELTMVHADPPYGMGKEADGVLNDNLYRDKLDAFQMAWWKAWRGSLADSGSAYIWGNAPDLWRLWWVGGLGSDPDLMVRNEIVWDKGSAIGMRSALEHSYPNATERCLFVMRGEQFLGNQNKDDFWEGYEPLRAWLEAERNSAGWKNGDVNRLTGLQMAGHWFSRSQFVPIPPEHYATLQTAATGRAFVKGYDELFGEMFPAARAGGNAYRRDLAAALRETRTYFDNAHDAMTDVWQFPRVHGEERQGHATPKPVAMVERAMLSSSRPGATIGVPFGGSGPEFIAAHRLDRRVVAMELSPQYVDVICRRYQQHTGTIPVRNGQPVDFTAGKVAA